MSHRIPQTGLDMGCATYLPGRTGRDVFEAVAFRSAERLEGFHR